MSFLSPQYSFFSLPPGGWEGIVDGNWSTFPRYAGTPPQRFNALLSTSETAFVLPFDPPCRTNRNTVNQTAHDEQHESALGSFHIADSKSWHGTKSCGRGSDLTSEAVDAYEAAWIVPLQEASQNDYLFSNKAHDRLTLIGANPITRNWPSTKALDVVGSLLQPPSVVQSFPFNMPYNRISMAYAYTAGAWYKEWPAMLCVGCRDILRYTAPMTTQGMSDDADRLLSVTLRSLKLSFASTDRILESHEFITTDALATLDPTYAFLELPHEMCEDLAVLLDLEYDAATDLYLMRDDVFVKLRESQPQLTLEVAAESEQKSEYWRESMNITLPLKAFDHSMTLARGAVRYFPIRRARKGRGNILGRVFFQETYMEVDFTRRRFLLSQAACPKPRPGWSGPGYVPGAAVPINVVAGWTLTGWTFDLLLTLTWLLPCVLLCTILLTRGVPALLRYTRGSFVRKQERLLKAMWIDTHTKRI